MSERVEVSFEAGIATVRLNRPEKHNGLDRAMFDALIAAGEGLMSRADLRAVVLSGAGPSFCAGLDFSSILADPDAMPSLLEREAGSVANRAQRAAWVWRELPVPVIAALHGAVYGGGLQIALGAEIRLAAPDTRLSVMEARYGLIPDMGITSTLPGCVRQDLAAELIYTARTVDAAEACAIGLVTRVVDAPLEAALALARRIADHSPDAIRAARRLLREAPDLDLVGRMRLEEALQVPLLGSANQLEAVMATMQRRPPQFVDPAF